MYDKEKGIYPSGGYLVGRDLPLGGYVFTAKKRSKRLRYSLQKL